MKKINLIGLGIMVILMVGCDSLAEDKYIVSEIRCSDIDLWNNRGNYDDFSCSLEYIGNNQALRICSATQVFVDNDFNVHRIYLNTTCVTTCYKNCYCDGKICFPEGMKIY